MIFLSSAHCKWALGFTSSATVRIRPPFVFHDFTVAGLLSLMKLQMTSRFAVKIWTPSGFPPISSNITRRLSVGFRNALGTWYLQKKSSFFCFFFFFSANYDWIREILTHPGKAFLEETGKTTSICQCSCHWPKPCLSTSFQVASQQDHFLQEHRNKPRNQLNSIRTFSHESSSSSSSSSFSNKMGNFVSDVPCTRSEIVRVL